MPVLYLLPVPIAEDALFTLPAYAIDIARNLDVFIVERAKTARHFIKSLGPVKTIQEMVFTEIDDNDPSVAVDAFREAIAAGKDIGLLSEAGCPGVADPGANIVALAHQAGIPVKPLVGPSSLLLALMASGMNGQRFAFHGYLPPKRPELSKDLKRLEQQSRQYDQTQLFIETPYRSQMVLEVALESLHPDTRFAIAQDISGTQEWIKSMPIKQWKKAGPIQLGKKPAVFLLLASR